MRCYLTSNIIYNFEAENCIEIFLLPHSHVAKIFALELACALMFMYNCKMYPCQLYHWKPTLIGNSICHIVTHPALWTCLVYSNISQGKKKRLCIIWKTTFKDFLLSVDISAVTLSQNVQLIRLLTDPVCPQWTMTCHRFLSSHIWGHYLHRLCPQSASNFLFFIYKVDIESCCVHNSDVAINVPFLITSVLSVVIESFKF